MYRQSIIIFGIVIPLVIAAIIFGVSSMLRGKVTSSLETKTHHYKGYESSKMSNLEAEAQIGRQREIFEKWSELLKQETFSLVTTNLREIGEKLPSKEFQQTAFERMNNSSGFGSVTAQKSSGVKFNLRGTYRTVQKALLELETRMPNLQLQELRIDPNSTAETSLLNFQLIYTAWEK